VESRYRALRDSLASRGSAAPSGLSEAERATMMEKIHFAHDRSELSATAKSVLRDKVRVFREHPSMQITITGYASAGSGTASYNRKLGLRRAEAAREYLVSQGIPKTRIAIASRGDNDLVVQGPGEVADVANRRIPCSNCTVQTSIRRWHTDRRISCRS
jgi:outer membrane protein OmpA-like peptidoglycan-associated protein